MGYDYIVTKGKELTIDISIYHKDGKQTSRSFKLPVVKGDQIYYEFFIEDGDLESR